VVREVISRLQAAGLVETRHCIGTFACEIPSPSGFRIDPASIVTLSDVLAVLAYFRARGCTPRARPTTTRSLMWSV